MFSGSDIEVNFVMYLLQLEKRRNSCHTCFTCKGDQALSVDGQQRLVVG